MNWNLSPEATAAILRAVDVFPGRGDAAEVFAVETLPRGEAEGEEPCGPVLKGAPAVVLVLTYGANVGAWRFAFDGSALDTIAPSPAVPRSERALVNWRAWFATFPAVDRTELAAVGFPSRERWSPLGSVAGLRLALQLGAEAARVREGLDVEGK